MNARIRKLRHYARFRVSWYGDLWQRRFNERF